MIRIFFAAAVLVLSSPALAAPIELRELSLALREYREGSREPVVESAGLSTEVWRATALRFDVDLLSGLLYFDNEVTGLVDRPLPGEDGERRGVGQYRVVGWEFSLGARLTDFADLGVRHHSRHVLDAGRADGGRFPAEDAVELRVYFFRKRPR